MKVRAEFNVKGQVQGVGYRYFVYRQAKKCNLNGYVKNMPNGTVKCIVEGEKGQIQILFRLLREGPSSARVRDVDVVWSTSLGNFTAFDIRY